MVAKAEFAFDPFRPSVTTLTGFKDTKSEEYEADLLQKAIDAEKDKRKKAATTQISDREYKVFHVMPNQNISIFTAPNVIR